MELYKNTIIVPAFQQSGMNNAALLCSDLSKYNTHLMVSILTVPTNIYQYSKYDTERDEHCVHYIAYLKNNV